MELAAEEAKRRREQISSPVADVKRFTSGELARVQLASDDQWFIEAGGTPIGPLSMAEVKERWLAHQIGPESRCWGVGFPGWVPLLRITALARALGPQPPRPVIAEPVPLPAPAPAKPRSPEPAAPALSPRRRSRPLAFQPEAEDVETASPRHELRSAGGAILGLAAAAGLVALMVGPPLLAPPTPEPIATLPPLPADPPPPAPVLPQRPPEHRAKKPAPTMEEAAPAPVPTAPPETEEAFDRAFGRPAEAPAAAEKPHTVYIPPAPPKVSKPKARLDAADVMAVVAAHRGQIVKCRRAALAEDPTISGKKLVMRWTVSPEGVTQDVEPLPSELQDFELASCLTQIIAGWKFPRHSAEQARITFPFVF